jgi:hypothetical protein
MKGQIHTHVLLLAQTGDENTVFQLAAENRVETLKNFVGLS